MDVEGAEFFVLRGAGNLLATCRPVILLEAHAANLKAYKIDIQELFSAIIAHGYKICFLDQTEVTEDILLLFDDEEYGVNLIAFPQNWQDA